MLIFQIYVYLEYLDVAHFFDSYHFKNCQILGNLNLKLWQKSESNVNFSCPIDCLKDEMTDMIEK